MALFGSFFKSRGEKKKEPRTLPAPAAAPVQPVPTSFPGKAPAGTTAPGSPEKPMPLDEIVAALQQIESIMAEPTQTAPPVKAAARSDHLQTLALSLSELVPLAPSSFNDMQGLPVDKVDVLIEDLFSQMSRGKIETTLGHLLAGVPKQYLANPADLESETKVALPLPLVVAAVDPNDFKKRTALQSSKLMGHDLPDLFKREDKKEAPPPAAAAEPAVPAVPKAAPVIPVPKAEPKSAAPIAPKAPMIPVAKPAPTADPATPFAGPAPKKFMPMDLVAGGSATPPPAENLTAPKIGRQTPSASVSPAPVSVSGIPFLLLRGLDLNQASAEDLTRMVDGIGEAMAQRIVEDRTENGPFFGLYDLGRVSGIGSKIYEKITGQPWLEEKYGQLPLVDELLGRWTGKHPDLKDVAAKFKEIAGFEGCMILHRDGDLLATSWQVESPDRFQAMVPQILKKVKHYMRHIAQGETYSVTVFLEGVSFTFVESEDICFVAVQNPKGLSRRHIQIINGLGVALGRRFSGYRGA